MLSKAAVLAGNVSLSLFAHPQPQLCAAVNDGEKVLMDRVGLGMSGLMVSRIALGTWQLGGDWGRTDEREAMAAIRRAREVGVNFFDTAHAYGFGASERLLGRALREELRSHRDEIVIATKGGLRLAPEGMRWDSSTRFLSQGVEESLRALGTEYIDLYQVHWPDPRTPFTESAAALQLVIDSGKVRHLGVSNFSVAQLEDFAQSCPVETLQPPYNLFHRDIEMDILPYCAAHDIGVLVYGPLAHSLLSGHIDPAGGFRDWRSSSPLFAGEAFRRNLQVVGRLEEFARTALSCSVSQLAIAWTLANPAVHVAIVGSRRAEQVVAAADALDIHLAREELARVDQIMADAVPIGVPSPGAT